MENMACVAIALVDAVWLFCISLDTCELLTKNMAWIFASHSMDSLAVVVLCTHP